MVPKDELHEHHDRSTLSGIQGRRTRWWALVMVESHVESFGAVISRGSSVIVISILFGTLILILSNSANHATTTRTKIGLQAARNARNAVLSRKRARKGLEKNLEHESNLVTIRRRLVCL